MEDTHIYAWGGEERRGERGEDGKREWRKKEEDFYSKHQTLCDP